MRQKSCDYLCVCVTIRGVTFRGLYSIFSKLLILRYRNWINSLGASPRIIRIYNDIKNGCALYDVLQKIDPKVCEKYKIDRPPYKKFSEMLVKLGNLDRVISIGKEMKFTLIGISGSDIYDENKKLTLALLWQMMRAYTVKVKMRIFSRIFKKSNF